MMTRQMRFNRERRRLLVGAGAAALNLSIMHSAFAQPATGQPYMIGVTYPLSGPAGSWGQLLVPAIEIGVQHVNEAGGIAGRPLALVVEDSKGSPEGAVSSMRKVIQVDGVQVIMTIFTNVVSAQMPLAQQFKVPLLSPVESPGSSLAVADGPSRIQRCCCALYLSLKRAGKTWG